MVPECGTNGVASRVAPSEAERTGERGLVSERSELHDTGSELTGQAVPTARRRGGRRGGHGGHGSRPGAAGPSAPGDSRRCVCAPQRWSPRTSSRPSTSRHSASSATPGSISSTRRPAACCRPPARTSTPTRQRGSASTPAWSSSGSPPPRRRSGSTPGTRTTR